MSPATEDVNLGEVRPARQAFAEARDEGEHRDGERGGDYRFRRSSVGLGFMFSRGWFGGAAHCFS